MDRRTRTSLLAIAVFAIAASAVAPSVQAAHILCLMGAASQGPRPWSSRLLEALAERGHHLAVVSADRPRPDQGPLGTADNVRFVHLEAAYDVIRAHQTQATQATPLRPGNAFTRMLAWHKFQLTTCQGVLASEGFGEAVALAAASRFDLVLHDSTHGAWCLLALAHLVPGAPVASLSAARLVPGLFEPGASRPASVPFFAGDLAAGRLGFGRRLHNAALYAGSALFRRLVAAPVVRAMLAQNKHVQSAQLPPDAGPLQERVRLVLVNAHPALDHAHPLPPHVVAVAGLHLEEPRPLPADLERFLEGGSAAGVVLVSLGPGVGLAQLGAGRVEAVLAVARRLPGVRFLWSTELTREQVRDPPPNLLLRRWLPQGDLLGDPRLRAFVSHAGWLGVQEAVHHGVPQLLLPLRHDQHDTARLVVERGAGLRLDLDALDEAALLAALTAVLEQPGFRQRARELQQAFRLRPQAPLDAAVWWLEQLLAQPRAFDLLVPPADARPGFFVARSLDVLALVAAFAALLVANCVVVGRQLVRGFRKARPAKTTREAAKTAKEAAKSGAKKSRAKKNQ